MQVHDYIRIAKRWVSIALILAVVAAVALYAFTRYTIRPLYTATVAMEVQIGLVSPTVNSLEPSSDTVYAETEAESVAQGPNKAGAARVALAGQHPPPTQAEVNTARSETSTRLAAAQRATMVRVVSPATPPSTPSSPHPTLNAVLAFIVVLLLVGAGGIVSDRLDDSIRGTDALKELTGLPLLGTIPIIDSLKDKPLSPALLILSSEPRSSSAEAFRVARTGIAFSHIDHPPRRILVTSIAQGEGKSTFASNIACSYAESGKSTILVDLDLRRHSLSSLAPARALGFTNLLLTQDGDPETYLVPGPLPGLRILPTGPLPPSPAEVISSHRTTEIIQRLGSMADVIVIDSPPVLAAADAAITASLCDGVVVLVRPDPITRRTLLRALETLKAVAAPLIDLVVNGAPVLMTGTTPMVTTTTITDPAARTRPVATFPSHRTRSLHEYRRGCRLYRRST